MTKEFDEYINNRLTLEELAAIDQEVEDEIKDILEYYYSITENKESE